MQCKCYKNNYTCDIDICNCYINDYNTEYNVNVI